MPGLLIIRRIRQNHALEHATIHILEEQSASWRIFTQLGGCATHRGFLLFCIGGSLGIEDVVHTVREALRRMQAGEGKLAVHLTCGTSMTTMGVLAGIFAFLATALADSSGALWPNAVIGGLIGVWLGEELGLWLQAKVTTTTNVDGVEVRRVVTRQLANSTVCFVETGD